MKENEQKLKKRAQIVINELKKLFPSAKIALNYSNNWELYVAVVLSAQCTDKKVNEVTHGLFKKYQTLDDYARADIGQFEQDIKSTGFFRNKARNILAAAIIIKKDHNGKMPDNMEDLLKIPGIGRKSANIILGNAYNIVVGIAVDTHVRRLANLYGLTANSNPDKIEQDLMRILPPAEWFDFTYRLIEYGRKYCPARKHDHKNCPLSLALRREGY